jgi:hypothetical protein
MPNITVTVSESAYRQARIWAATHNTSVSAIVQYCIERLPTMRLSVEATAATARRRKQPSAPAAEAGDTPSPHPKNPGCETVKPKPAQSIQPLSQHNLTVSQKL